MLGISNISNARNVNSINFRAKVEKTDENPEVNDLERTPEEDSLEMQHKKGEYDLTKEDKQEILYNARKKAAGWSIFGLGFSTLYYGLRSDKKVAQKFNLDVEKDQKLIKKIKRDQMLATIPAVIGPSLGGVVAYIYCKTQDPAEINVA